MALRLESFWLGLRYFFLFPIFGLLPSPLPYLLARHLSHLEHRFHRSRRERIEHAMSQYGKDLPSREAEPGLATRRYFEVIFCDEMDVYIYLLGFSKRFSRGVKIEGKEYLEEALKNRGGILLSAHFGGGFWILPFLRERGVSAQFFSADIEKENYPAGKALYYYHRLRMGAVEKVSGARALYKKEGRAELKKALTDGKWVIVLFDVPPFLVRDVMEVPFLSRRAVFPKGIISIAEETCSPILPFFSFLDGGKQRRILFEKPFRIDDVEAGVTRCVTLIERNVTERPDHWHLWSVADSFFKDTTG